MKQDRQGVRKASDIEQKYKLNNDFSAIEKLATEAQRTAALANARANNAAADANKATQSVANMSESVSDLGERVDTLEETGGGGGGTPGKDGATFTPSVDSDGNLSWTNDKGLENPATVNIKGEKGDAGEDGSPGVSGVSCTHSWNGTTLTVTSASGTTSADLKGDKGDKGDPGESVSFTTDNSLTLENDVLKVNAADAVEADNNLPVTSAAVYAVLGDIESLLSTI